MAAEIHVGDTGTKFLMTLKKEDDSIANLSGVEVTSVDFVFKKPDATTITRVTSFETNGTDGQVKYVTTSSDLSISGKWSIQAYVNTTNGVWHSNITKFDVKANLK